MEAIKHMQAEKRKFRHYILTRFNLGIYTRPDSKEWMKHRINIFDNVTLPSYLRQTNKNSFLILAFDEETPYDVIRKYDYIDNIIICFEQPHLYLRGVNPETEWIITSRLDNDDKLHKDYIKEIQNEFMEKLEVIDVEYEQFILGKSNIKYTSERYRANSPFLSLVEKWENIKTAMARPHTYMPDDFPSRKIQKVLAYMVIHDRNVCNKIVGKEIK